MPGKTRQTAAQLFALALALGVGILIGARSCTPEPTERVVKTPAEVVYRCPEPDVAAPDAGPTQPAAVAPSEPTRKHSRALPEDPGPAPADQRRKLLSWARDQSAGLIGCRRGSASPGSVIVTFHIDETGALDDVELTTPSNDDITPSMLTCVRSRMRKWEPPKELVEGRRRVVFGLDL